MTRARSVNDDFRQARRHSRRVHVLKIALPAAAIVMAAAFMAYSGLSGGPSVSVDIADSGLREGKLVMSNPKLDGFTRDNLPYSMTARRAVQAVGNTDVIELEQIDAAIPVDTATTARIDAASGIYDNSAGTLKITSPLTVRTDDGMVARLQSAFINVGDGNLETAQPVDIERRGSRIRADSMTITERGKVLIFENRVRLTIQPAQLKSGGDEDKASDESD